MCNRVIKISEGELHKLITESVKEVILNEYLDKYFGNQLRHYLQMSDDDKKYNKLQSKCYYFANFFEEWISRNDIEVDDNVIKEIKSCSEDYDWDGINSILIKEFGYGADEIINDFLREIQKDGCYYDMPKTYDVMEYGRTIKNEWLVHFSDNALSIFREGFQYATYDPDDLSYSNAGQTKGKHHEGWDFAFLANRVNNWYCDNYGREAILFKASGVEAYHYGDDEYQVMFYNKDAKDLIYLQRAENGDWYVESNITGNILYETDDISDLIAWVINNLPQYRRHLINSKESKIRRDNFKKSDYNYNRQFKG